jgi:hypothetical protein
MTYDRREVAEINTTSYTNFSLQLVAFTGAKHQIKRNGGSTKKNHQNP